MLSEAATYMIAMMVSLILWSLYIGLFFTGSLCVTLVKLGFVTYPDGPETYFYLYDSRGMDNKWWLAADFWSISATMASDIFMFWRVYIVWSGDKRVIYFLVLLVVIVGVGRIMILAFNIMYSQRFADPVFVAQDNALNLAVRWTALADTWYSTGFICFRLWSMERRKRGVGAASHEDFWTDLTDHYGKIARVLIQSGMLYSATYVAFIMCLTLENRGGANIINFMNVRIIGIAVTLIIHASGSWGGSLRISSN
ncbi:hypothetical protein FRB93_006666 [Tulasnella sp. JGI-2019a]|nr:hypothetical protein FRB93_006666 [Tulasnella sp. JGI-2019a]